MIKEFKGSERLKQQMRFMVEIDRLKSVNRRSPITTGERRENSAEHSWHVAMMAWLLSEHANDQSLDFNRVLKMMLIHDIVEIDAGDTYIYDEAGQSQKFEKEKLAAERIFGLLPKDQADELMELWLEYEEQETKESKFATSLDRLQPVTLNAINAGEPWTSHSIKYSQCREINDQIAEGSKSLWECSVDMIDQCREQGVFSD